MQVALATLWSCFPVSASGADMLLFSLLHTSSGSCCSAETNHGLLRLCVCPPIHPHPSFCHSHFLLYFFLCSSLSLSRFLPFCFVFSGSLHPRFCSSHSLCFPLVTPRQPSLSMGIQDAQRKGRGQDLSEAALPGEIRERRGTSFSPPPPQPLRLTELFGFIFPEKAAASRFLPRWTFTCFTCLIVCVWLWRSGRFSFFFLPPLSGCVSLAANPQCGLQIRRKLYCLCFVVIQSRLQIRLSSLLHYQGGCNRGVFTVCTVSQGTFKSSQVDVHVLPKLIIIIGCLG